MLTDLHIQMHTCIPISLFCHDHIMLYWFLTCVNPQLTSSSTVIFFSKQDVLHICCSRWQFRKHDRNITPLYPLIPSEFADANKQIATTWIKTKCKHVCFCSWALLVMIISIGFFLLWWFFEQFMLFLADCVYVFTITVASKNAPHSVDIAL